MSKAFDPNSLPKGFPPEGLMNQHGKPYITHVGLVWLANHRGKPWNGTIVSHDIKWNQSGHPHAAVVVFKVWDDEREHTDIGDACATNVGKMIVPHLVRMASTRAQNRALRAFVGYAGCTADELELGEAYGGGEGDTRGRPPEANRGQPHAAQNGQQTQGPPFNIRTNSPHKCPACGGSVWDERAQAIPAREQGKRIQYFKCSRKGACPGGKGQYGWGEWENPDFFEADDMDAAQQPAMTPPPDDVVRESAKQMAMEAEGSNYAPADPGPPMPGDGDIPF